MNSIHDHNIYEIEIRCGVNEIVFHTNLNNDDSGKRKEILFKGVIGHRFFNVLDGNIILDITKEDPIEFFKTNESILQDYYKNGLPVNCSNAEHFKNSLNLRGVTIFMVNPSYGMSGWIIAKEYKVFDKK